AADHQERAVCVQPVQLFDNRLGCRSPEHDLIHRAEYDTTFMHDCPPGHFWPLLRALLQVLAPRLAEEIRDVMHEDDAVAPSYDGGLRRHVFVTSRRLAGAFAA